MNKLMRREAKEQRRADRMSAREARPVKSRDEAFVTGGKAYHDFWCAAVNGVWLSGSNNVEVVPRNEVVSVKEPCGLCAGMGVADGRTS